ncbi:MAG TPA: YbaB/EbfC family nucleoid-associated protein [Nonomuraea sp.]|nr:YbaB/EbfC family nucleoid-associated protein [Nonomuraea sp.]
MTTPGEGIPIVDEEINRLLAEFQTETRPLEALQENINSLRGRGEAANGEVEVEVLPSGALSGLKINPRALRLGSEALAAAVLAAANNAAADAAKQMSEMLVGGLSPFTQEVRRFSREQG